MTSSLTGLSPNNPRDYLGPNVSIPIVVSVPREPTSADIKQPSTGKYYSFSTFWLVGKNPTTGSYGDLWYLSNIVNNQSNWIRIAAGGTGDGPILTVTGDTGGPIDPDTDGNIDIVGDGSIFVTGTANTLTAGVTNWVPAISNNWVPQVVGSGTPGAATYTFRQAAYSRVGNMVFFSFNMTWNAHTGSGNIQITGFPITFAMNFQSYPVAALVQNITLPSGSVEVFFNGTNGATSGNLVATVDNAAVSNVVLPSAGTIACTGFYYSNV